jgi:hypothetical protein
MRKGIGECRAITLTAGVDAPALSSGNDTISGVYGDGVAANTSYSLGDKVVDSSTTDSDTLELTLTGTTASALVTVTNIENIKLNNIGAGANTFNANLVTGAKTVVANVATAGHTQTVANLASLDTVVELQGKGNLTATTTATLTGTADTVSVNLNGAGTSAATRSTVTVSNTNAIEGVKIAATGANYVDLDAGTANKTITVTGAGSLDLQGAAAALTGDATNNALTIDASAATGKQTYNLGAGAITVTGGAADDTFKFGTTLGSTDKVDGGAGNDTVTMELGTAVQVNPELTNIETLTAKFSAAGVLNASKAASLTTVNIEDTTAAITLTNLAAGAKTVNFVTDAAAVTSGAVALGYASGAAADITVNVGEIDTGTTGGVANKGDAIELGAVTLSNVAKLTLNSVRDTDNTALVANTLTSLDVGTATEVKVTTSDKASISTGNLTGASVTKLTVAADGGAATTGTFVGAALTDLVLTSANKAALTTGALGTANNATTASKLVNYSVTTGAETTVNLGAIDAATKSAATGLAASALKTVSYDLGSKATVTAIGAVDSTDENGANGNANAGVAQLDSVSIKLGADAVGAVTVGNISARSVTSATFAIADQTAAHTTAAGLIMDEAIGALSVTSGKNETITLTVNGIDDGGATDLYNLAIGNVTIAGDGNVVLAGLSTGVKSIAAIDASTLKGTLQVAASTLSGTAGTTITIGEGGTTATGVSGSDKADIITGGKGADVILGGAGADQLTGGLGADTITGGAGQDTIDLTEATSSVDKIFYAESGAANVDTVSGFKAGTDIVQFTIGNVDGAATYNFASAGGTDVNAAGAATAATVAVNTSAAVADAANLLFFSNTAATSFATAIGTAVITDTTGTNWTNTTSVAAVYFDSLNGQAVFGYVVDSAAAGTALTSADSFVEITRVGMTSTDYTAANVAASFAFA